MYHVLDKNSRVTLNFPDVLMLLGSWRRMSLYRGCKC